MGLIQIFEVTTSQHLYNCKCRYLYLFCRGTCIWNKDICILNSNVCIYVPQPKGMGDILLLVRIPSASSSALVSALLIVCTLSPEPEWVDFDQTCTDTLLGGKKEVIRFWWPWPYFQGHSSTLKFSNFEQNKLVCTLSLEPNDGF